MNKSLSNCTYPSNGLFSQQTKLRLIAVEPSHRKHVLLNKAIYEQPKQKSSTFTFSLEMKKKRKSQRNEANQSCLYFIFVQGSTSNHMFIIQFIRLRMRFKSPQEGYSHATQCADCVCYDRFAIARHNQPNEVNLS